MPEEASALPARVNAALNRAKRLTRSLDDVQAVDYGFVYEDGKITKRTGIRFHMNRKRRLTELSRGQRLPKTIEGVRVDVLGVGYEPHADGGPRTAHDPLQPGISVGSRKLRTTGTLGPIVRDANSQQLYLMSNWHVLCGGPEAEHNDEITQPGPMDLVDGRTVALLDRWLRLGEQFDVAIARLGDGVRVVSELFETEFKPVRTKPPALGMRLLKSGAASNVTHAKVDGINGSYWLDYTSYGDGPQWMQGFRLVPDAEAPADAISRLGDSGSLWIDSADGSAVGLHFAGEGKDSPLKEYALAHPIEEVFARLNVALIST